MSSPDKIIPEKIKDTRATEPTTPAVADEKEQHDGARAGEDTVSETSQSEIERMEEENWEGKEHSTRAPKEDKEGAQGKVEGKRGVKRRAEDYQEAKTKAKERQVFDGDLLRHAKITRKAKKGKKNKKINRQSLTAACTRIIRENIPRTDRNSEQPQRGDEDQHNQSPKESLQQQEVFPRHQETTTQAQETMEANKETQGKWVELVMKTRKEEISCPRSDCLVQGRLAWNGRGSSGKVAKCMACSKKVGIKKLYDHIVTQLGGGEKENNRTEKISLDLPENPPSTPNEWKTFCTQIRQVVDTANNISTQMEEVKKQLHRTTEQLQALNGQVEKEKDARHRQRELQQQQRREIIERPVIHPYPFPKPKESAKNPFTNPYQSPPQNAITPTLHSQADTTANQATKKSYLEIAKIQKPKIDSFPEPIRERVIAGRAAMASFVKPQQQRKIQPEAVYFSNAQRGPLLKLREALRMSLPREAILHLDFVGGSLLEVICHEPLANKLIAHIHYMSDGRMRRINFDPIAKATITKEQGNADKERWASNLKHCVHRIERILKGKPWTEVREYFKTMKKKAEETLKDLENTQEETVEEEDGWTKVIRKKGAQQTTPSLPKTAQEKVINETGKKSTQDSSRENQEKEKNPTQADDNE